MEKFAMYSTSKETEMIPGDVTGQKEEIVTQAMPLDAEEAYADDHLLLKVLEALCFGNYYIDARENLIIAAPVILEMEDEIWGDRMEQILLDIETVASLNSGKLQPDEVEL